MRRALIVSPNDLERLLGRTALWRQDVQRARADGAADALEQARSFRPNLVVIEGGIGRDVAALVRSLRLDPATRCTAIVALRPSSALEEQRVREAGANLVLPEPIDPLLWDDRLAELLSVPPRREARVPVRLRPWSDLEPGEATFDGLALNVSEHGALIESARRLAIGTRVDIGVRLPGTVDDLELVGQVVRVEASPRSGVKFVAFRGQARERIRTYVAEEERWESELRASEARKAAVLEAALDSVITMDQEGRILDFNGAAERTFGCDRAEVVGRRVEDVIIPARLREAHRQGLERHLATGAGRMIGRRVETTARRADGSEFPVELAITAVEVPGGRLFTGYLRDISDRKRAESIMAAQHALARVLAEAPTLREAAPRILEAICASFGWDLGALWVAEGDTLRCVETWRAPALGTSRLESFLHGTSLARGDGLPGRVWAKAEPVWIPDLEREPELLPRAAGAPLDGLAAAVGLPVLLAEKVLGVVECYGRQPRAAQPDLLRCCLTMGSQIGQFMERKRANEAVAAAEQRFRTLVENSAEAISLLSANGRPFYFSPSAERVLGYPAEELVGRSPFELVHPDDAERARSLLLNGFATPGGLLSSELRVRHKDGRWRWIELDIVNRLDDPQVRALVANYRDITERKTAEELLWESESRLREVVGAAPIVLWAVDSEGIFTLSEGRGLGALGLRPGQVVGQSVFEFYRDHPEICASVRRALAGEETSKVVTVGSAAFDAHFAPVRGPGGGIVGATGVAIDVSERRMAELAVAEQRDFLRRVLDISPSFIFAKDREGRFTLANQAVAEAYGTTVEALLGRTDADFNPNADEVAAFRRDDLAVMDSHREKLVPEELITDARGGRRWLQTVKRPLVGPDGVARQVLGFASDITARKRAEAIQSALYRIARATNVARDLSSLYAEIHAIVGELMYAKNFYIAHYDESAQLLSFPYFVDERAPPPGPKRLGRGLTEYVLTTARPLLASPEAFADLQRAGEVELIGAPSLDWLGVPLTADDRTLGVLVLQSYSEAVRYGETEMQILTFVSQQIAEAIERKRAEDARTEALLREEKANRELAESEQRFRLLADHVPGVIYLCRNDERYSMIYLNDAVEALTGREKREFLEGRVHFPDLYHPQDAAAIRAAVEAALAARQPFQLSYRLRHRSGAWRRVEERGVGVWSARGELLFLEGFLSDVTDDERRQGS